jgi:hypothetical protein
MSQEKEEKTTVNDLLNALEHAEKAVGAVKQALTSLDTSTEVDLSGFPKAGYVRRACRYQLTTEPYSESDPE